MNAFDNYIDQYQTLLDQARLWSRNNKNPTYLLVGEKRKNAQLWLKQWFEVQDGLPEPKPLHYKFIEESYKQDFYDVLMIYDSTSLDLAIQFQAELINHGFRVWGKHNSIEQIDLTLNKTEIIQRSDNILILGDQKFLSSEIGQEEVQIAKGYNKHIISILVDKARKYIDKNKKIFYENTILEKLINPIKVKLKNNNKYIRKHSYFLVKALEWEWYNKPINYLLIGDELTQAKEWLEQSQEKETPCKATEIQREYIEESINSSQGFFDAFISYGRADSLGFVTKIYQKLTEKGYRIWFDMQEIPYAVNYQKQIDNGIERAKNFIFFMAPHSVNSPYCGKEIDLAVNYKKRLIPVLHLPEIDEQTWKQRYPHKDWETAKEKGEHTSDRNPNLHPAISYPNWIRYSDHQNFEKLIQDLENLFQTQIDYVTQHTYILDRALEWERHERRTEYLLIGEERKQAEKWLVTEFKNKQHPCEPSLLHCEYIAQSKKNANNLMTQVFICGATEDEEIKDKITQSLIRKGFTVWTAKSDLRVEEKLEEGIKRGIDEADNFIYLLSHENGLQQLETDDWAKAQLQTDWAKAQLQTDWAKAQLQTDWAKAQLQTDWAKAQLQRVDWAKAQLQRDDWAKAQLQRDDWAKAQLQRDDWAKAQLQTARSRHKRIFILLVGEVKELPSDNIIDFTNPEIYDESLQRLIRGLNEDSSYYERHKILLAKALKWKQQPDNVSLLLRGYNLREAENWLKEARLKTQHSATPEHEEFINTSLRQPSGGSLDVFISYSRADSDFARKLNDELQMRGKTTWFDQESIATGVDFGEEIKRGIETSDNFVFIISPRSIKSPYCKGEVSYAKSLNKRIITILHRPVNGVDLEVSGLGGIQWLDFYQSEKDFNDLLSQLVRTIDTDKDHLHTHTELSLKALEWEAKKRDLLSETELLSAKQWLETADKYKKQPPPTELQRRFISESEKALLASKRKQKHQIRTLRLLLAGMSVAFLAAVGVSVLALNLRRQAQVLQASAIGRYAAITFDQNQQLNALKEALAGARQLQKLGATDNWVLLALQKIVYGIRERNQLVHDGAVTHASFSPDGNIIASASWDKTVKLWNRKGKLLSILSHDAEVNHVSFSPDGNIIASASWDNSVKLWNREGKLLSTLLHNDGVNHVSFSPDGNIIASASLDKTVKLWNREGKLLSTLSHNDGVNHVSFSPDGNIIASASWDNSVKLWNREGKLLSTLLHNDGVNHVSFSPDGNIIASASLDKTVKLWNRQGKRLWTLSHDYYVNHVSFSPDGNIIASASLDNSVKLWNREAKRLSTLSHDGDITDVSLSPDGNMIASASLDNNVKLWNREAKLLSTLPHNDRVNHVSFSPDGKTIASASLDHTVKLWNREGKLLTTLPHNDRVNHVSLSPDGKTIAVASLDDTVKLWNREGKLLSTLSHDAEVNHVSFSPDGNIIASASWDKTVKLWNRKGKLLSTLSHNDGVYDISFSPDGNIIASASFDNTVKLWNEEGTLLSTLPHNDRVNHVSFSPDGKMIASASSDHTVKLWNSGGKLLSTLSHNDEVIRVNFSPDGNIIASASGHQVILWDFDLDPLMMKACDWGRDYLTNSRNVKDEERKLCDGVIPKD